MNKIKTVKAHLKLLRPPNPAPTNRIVPFRDVTRAASRPSRLLRNFTGSRRTFRLRPWFRPIAGPHQDINNYPRRVLCMPTCDRYSYTSDTSPNMKMETNSGWH